MEQPASDNPTYGTALAASAIVLVETIFLATFASWGLRIGLFILVFAVGAQAAIWASTRSRSTGLVAVVAGTVFLALPVILFGIVMSELATIPARARGATCDRS